MNYAIQFVHPWAMAIGCLILGAAYLWRHYFYRQPRYIFALTNLIKQRGGDAGQWRRHVITALRLFLLSTLALALGRPQLTDLHSLMRTEGIDIMLTLDVSGSMTFYDDLRDRRNRLQVAIEEAKQFVDKRDNDTIGLVLFASDAIARLPMTFDKRLIKEVLDEVKIGIVNPDTTLLMTAIATAASRLRHSKARSKVIILLTDGQPSSGDRNTREVIDIVKAIGAKIYAIGIGNREGAIVIDELGRPFLYREAGVNEELLTIVAHETGGRYFTAQKPEDMKTIYETIDVLEKTEIENPFYRNNLELGVPLVLGALVLLLLEVLIRSCLWRML